MKKLMGMLVTTPTLRKGVYKEGIPIYMVVDTSQRRLGGSSTKEEKVMCDMPSGSEQRF